MFWGLIVEPKKRYTQTVKSSFHVSGAVIDPEYKGDGAVTLFVQVDGQDYALSTLKKEQRSSLDLNFEEGTLIVFHTKGDATVHLTGYLIPEDHGEGDSFLDSEADAEELSGEEEEEEVPQLQKVKGKEGKATTSKKVEDEDEREEEEESEESDEEPEPPKKQPKKEPAAATKPATTLKDNGEVLSKSQKKKLKQEAKKDEKTSNVKKVQGGVLIQDLVVGNGPEAKPGKKIAVFYVGRLQSSNKQFDAMQKGPGFKFRLGSGEVIKGWDVGIAGMKVGGKRRITCPHQMAYGTKGAPPTIPPNSTLVFDVELRNVL